MKRIALIAKFGWVGISTSLINTALFWEKKEYAVDIYLEQPDEQQFPFPDFPDRDIRIIRTSIRSSRPWDDITFCRKHFERNAGYEWVIGFDFEGLLRAGICQIFHGGRVIYHSLEFYEPKRRTLKSTLGKLLEGHFAGRAAYVFTQHPSRVEFLEADLGLPNAKFRLIYNSPSGSVVRDSADFFRQKFRIGRDCRIVLCAGSLMRETLVVDIVESVKTWDKKFVLVLHGWFPDKAVRAFVQRKQEETPGRIHVSDRLFEYGNKYVPFQSCDIGFVGFSSETNNLKYAAGSAGKLFDFLRTGKPIIAIDSPGMAELVEGNAAGFVFTDARDVSSVLRKVDQNYDTISQCSFAAFGRYEFEEQYEKVFATLDWRR